MGIEPPSPALLREMASRLAKEDVNGEQHPTPAEASAALRGALAVLPPDDVATVYVLRLRPVMVTKTRATWVPEVCAPRHLTVGGTLTDEKCYPAHMSKPVVDMLRPEVPRVVRLGTALHEGIKTRHAEFVRLAAAIVAVPSGAYLRRGNADFDIAISEARVRRWSAAAEIFERLAASAERLPPPRLEAQAAYLDLMMVALLAGDSVRAVASAKRHLALLEQDRPARRGSTDADAYDQHVRSLHWAAGTVLETLRTFSTSDER
jgi:hypothetical protein